MDAFKGCDNLTLTVLRDSYAAQYAQEEKLKYGYDGHVKIVGGDVNIRAEPDKTAGKLGYIKYGRTVRYLGRSSVDDRGVCWYEIRYNGVTGWVSSRYSEIA